MRDHIKISFFTLIILAIIGCKNFDEKEKTFIQKEYGKRNSKSGSLSVELKLNEFSNWSDLLKRTERIVCNDSVPKVTLKNDKEIKSIYLHNLCWDDYACILIKEKEHIRN